MCAPNDLAATPDTQSHPGRNLTTGAHLEGNHMATSLEGLHAADGERVASDAIATAITAGGFVYDDGSTQSFDANGTTTYNEQGRPTAGEWYVDDNGRFCSYWPPSYRACYDLFWIVEHDAIVGLRFEAVDNGSRFDGRYQ